MKKFSILLLLSIGGFAAFAQDTITNGGFERWGNTVPSGDSYTEPTTWYSNQSASTIAAFGPQTCFKSTMAHSGLYSVEVVTESYLSFEAVNGVVTTGVVDAPSTNKSDGYIGTENFNDSTTDDRRMPFTGRPDSLVGWYQYLSGGAGEQGKIRCILHVGDYYDPETPTTYHMNPTANRIADDTFFTPMANVSTWTRFSVPFTYVSTVTPTYIMINVTSSANQTTSITGSTLWLDDLQVIYNPTAVTNPVMKEDDAKVYAYNTTVCVSFNTGNELQSVLTIMDMTGKQVFSRTITNDKFSSFDLPYLKPGLYIYQLNNSSYLKTGKLFIQ